MTLDGLTLHGVVDELGPKLQNAKVQKVLMPTKEEIVLIIYSAAEGTMRLVISADAGDCGIYLSSHAKENPKTPPVFCMFLRKNLVGGVITAVEQSGLDRVVTLRISTRDELMRTRELSLIAEIMGKYSNIILTDADGRILDSVKRVPLDVSRERQILPGLPYEAPPQHKWNPLTSSPLSLSEAIHPLESTRMDRVLSRSLDGISVQTAHEVLALAGLSETAESSRLEKRDFMRLASDLQSFVQQALARPQPSIQVNADGVPVFFSLVPYASTYPAEGRRTFPSVNEMLDYYYSRRSELQRVAQAKTALSRVISKSHQKTVRHIQLCEMSLAEASQIRDLQRRADQITANLYRLHKGMKEFESTDYETGETLTVPLDVSETPAQTAQRLYRRIAKYKRARELNTAKLEEARSEEEFLSGALLYTENAATLAELSEIRRSLMDAGVVARPKKDGRRAAHAESKPLRYLSPSGMTIYVGRNDRQNETLTHRIAQRDDIWFHAQKIPGSHVLLVTNGRDLNDIDDETIVFAAELAAAHSRARRSGKTPVDYTQRRNVRKPPQARPGKVIYDNYYTVYVDAAAGQEKMAEPEGPPLGTI
ncbi:MAG: fibronectin/fibrinogen-binding protein [Clostridia bacterium]|nr:fibronectin/fibrinogen-binding protein [Clostridia bacterium]